MESGHTVNKDQTASANCISYVNMHIAELSMDKSVLHIAKVSWWEITSFKGVGTYIWFSYSLYKNCTPKNALQDTMKNRSLPPITFNA